MRKSHFGIQKLFFVSISLMCFIQLTYSQVLQNRDVQNNSFYKEHEKECKNRYREIQTKLDECAAKNDTNGVRFLSAQLDAQLKIEDFLIRFREAEHAKFSIYYTVIVSALVSLLVALIPLFIKRKTNVN